jgi:hypothetical protein
LKFYFNRVFELPWLRNAQENAPKKSSKTTEGEKKQRKNPQVFCDKPRCFFGKIWGFFVFELSLLRNAPKKKINNQQINK